MNIRHEQIVGIIDNDNNIDYKIFSIHEIIKHKKEWKNIKKSWRVIRCELIESELTPEFLTEKEKNDIKKIIEKNLNIKVKI